MFRVFMASVVGGFGPFIVLGLSIAAGVSAHSWTTFVVTLIVAGFILYIVYQGVMSAGRVGMDAWLSSHNDCKYRYAYDGCGIAVDPVNKKIFLASKFNGKPASKEYSLSDVREWEYIVQGKTVHTPGKVIGGGLQGASHNMGEAMRAGAANAASAVRAAESTGMKVRVADIDFPQWFIKFKPQKGLETELLRWMEILQQSVNEA